MPKTWESMWEPLLSEATRLCTHEEAKVAPPLPRCVASVLLARSSIDAYLSEFVEWRRLPHEVKHLRIRDAISQIFENLSLDAPTFQEGHWNDVLLLNEVRNEAVHHKARRYKLGKSPSGLIERLAAKGVITLPPTTKTWENIVYSDAVARWACSVAGRSVVYLESISRDRLRSLLIVQERVNQILSRINCSIDATGDPDDSTN